MIKLKEGDAYIVTRDTGEIDGTGSGFFQRDTRWISTWRWELGSVTCLATQATRNELFQHFALTDAHKAQMVSIERQVCVSNNGFTDSLSLTNTSMLLQTIHVSLICEADFRDIFTIWAQKELDAGTPVDRNDVAEGLSFSRQASDGVRSHFSASFEPHSSDQSWTFTLAPKENRIVRARACLDHVGLPEADENATCALPNALEFSERDNLQFDNPNWQRAYKQANEDLRTLLLPTQFGPYPAAGLPNFVNFFGRDALITSMMIGHQHADISKSVLRFLAQYQGTCSDPFREEEPGKILHEIRRGELSRSGSIPFGRYYGSVDSTPLFIMALGHYVKEAGDPALAQELYKNWTAALDWLVACQTDEGLVRFKPSGSGLTVQSWKDSHDSMNYADGTPARAPLAVAEVQGYAYAAFVSAADLFMQNNESSKAQDCRIRAERLKQNFHKLFWLPQLNTYAMALDKDGTPLAVQSSDPGHLLWTGIVPEDAAQQLVNTLMSPECWSGWGLRTLGTNEVRYNPVSYHNGSVWPHDTALFGAGLARYGFRSELKIVTEALFALAGEMPGYSLPELVCGYPRTQGRMPISYTHACSPQAWSAAGLLMLARFAME